MRRRCLPLHPGLARSPRRLEHGGGRGKPLLDACAERAGTTAVPRVRASGRQRGLRLVDYSLERRRLLDREIRKHLAVDNDARLAESGDESTISQPELAHGSVEPLNPQCPERALAAFAVAKRILVGLFDRLLRDPYGVLAPAVITLGGFEDFLVLGVCGNAPFDAGHGGSPSKSWRYSLAWMMHRPRPPMRVLRRPFPPSRREAGGGSRLEGQGEAL